MKSHRLYYNVIHEFNHQYYGSLLRAEHLIQRSQKRFKEFFIPGALDPVEEDFYAYVLNKDGINYLISATNEDNEEIDILNLLPVEMQDLQKVSDRKGDVYFIVRNPVPMRIRPSKEFTPKEFFDNLCLLAHSNPRHQKLMFFMALSQLWDRSYYRIASPAATGKDSSNDILAAMFGDTGVIESPTLAKLEDRASNTRWLVVNEIMDIGKSEWDIIQQFLLTAGAHKNKILKHSRAFQNVGEVIDISKFSLSLFYNDIISYPDGKGGFKPYLDEYTKSAVLDRFPAFRLYGRFTEDFNSMNSIDVEKFVKKPENWDFFIKMVRTYLYYKENYMKYMHNWNTDKLTASKGRDATNIGRLVRVADMCSSTQEEFDEWLVVINEARMDYLTMLQIPKHWHFLIKKLEKQSKNENELSSTVVEYLTQLRKKNTAGEMIQQIREWIKEDVIKKKSEEKDIFEFGIDGDIL